MPKDLDMRPAQQLKGHELDGGWRVVEHLQRSPTATGGKCSSQYIVENSSGRRGFLKAMDYTEALEGPNTSAVLNALTQAYLFEKKICDKCKNKGMRRVLHAIASGEIHAQPGDPMSKVEYLIFDLADNGDIRAHLDASDDLDLAFLLKAAHHVAVGLYELHTAQIAHQDLKPSNVLVFSAKVGTKISDLGRAWDKHEPSPFDRHPVAGDRGYAPPESMYGATKLEEPYCRFASDLYQLGSVIHFFFTRIHMNAAIVDRLAFEHRPLSWNDSFEGVLPYLQGAFSQALGEFQSAVPEVAREELVFLVTYLCDPDPSNRGHPLNANGSGNPYSLQRTVSALDLLAKKAAVGAWAS